MECAMLVATANDAMINARYFSELSSALTGALKPPQVHSVAETDADDFAVPRPARNSHISIELKRNNLDGFFCRIDNTNQIIPCVVPAALNDDPPISSHGIWRKRNRVHD